MLSSAAPGFISRQLYTDDLQPGWLWRTYLAKNTVLLADKAGLKGSTAMCASLSEGGAVSFVCTECATPGYQPFAADAVQFWIRSSTTSREPFASSTPPGQLPGLKLFLKNVR
jgi:hypothetical protein